MAPTKESAARKDSLGGDACAFQHRHYAYIAATLAKNTDLANAGTVARRMARAFEANPRFDRKRFLAACGYPED